MNLALAKQVLLRDESQWIIRIAQYQLYGDAFISAGSFHPQIDLIALRVAFSYLVMRTREVIIIRICWGFNRSFLEPKRRNKKICQLNKLERIKINDNITFPFNLGNG